LALTSPTSGGRSVGIVRSRFKDKEFSLVLVFSLLVLIYFVTLVMIVGLQHRSGKYNLVAVYTSGRYVKASITEIYFSSSHILAVSS
jgi:hypothetical protein